jgi:anti-sigma B factor antagonist
MNAEIEILEPSGRLDVTSAGQFRRQVSQISTMKPKFLLIDLKNISFMDSSGLGALVSALKTMRSVDGDMAICSASDQVQMLFELTSMSKIFKIYSSRDDFNAKVGAN